MLVKYFEIVIKSRVVTNCNYSGNFTCEVQEVPGETPRKTFFHNCDRFFKNMDFKEHSDSDQSKEHEEENNSRTWLGTSLSDICKGAGPWSFYTSPVKASRYHCVLYELPLNKGEQPIPHCTSEQPAWDEDHVRMPYSHKNLFPVKENDVEVLKPRWEIIKDALSEPINSSYDLEQAISRYSSHLPKLSALHHFFTEVLEEEEATHFFNCVLPGIIDLALDLPDIIPGNIPLLKKTQSKSVSLSQVQVASLLANAFLCTFPWRKDVALTYPGVNFVRLFCAHSRPRRANCVAEKLKCICHYFRKVLSKHPVGVVTFERKYLPKSTMPRWDRLDKNLGNTKVHIDSSGTIEDNGLGFLQIDFANRNIGGGVLNYGCVQEEIRFVICPELIVSRLFIEQMGDNEAVVITGVERYSKYIGYGDSFEWNGDVCDEVPYDEYGRRKTTIAVIDATHFNKPSDQFYPSAILRELNKAYVGFSCREKQNLAPVATGNWGCGAFRGSPYLKTLIQLIACCAANRDLVYYSFGNEELRDSFHDMYLFLGNYKVTVIQLWKFLCSFISADLPEDRLYSYIQQSYFDNKKQKSVKDYFRTSIEDFKFPIPSTSKKKEVSSSDQSSPEEETPSQADSVFDEDVIPSTPGIQEIPIEPVKCRASLKKLPNNHDDILQIIEAMDGKSRKNKDGVDSCSFLSELDKAKKKQKSDSVNEVKIDIEDDDLVMEVDSSRTQSINSPLDSQKKSSKKITDYFTKTNKSSY